MASFLDTPPPSRHRAMRYLSTGVLFVGICVACFAVWSYWYVGVGVAVDTQLEGTQQTDAADGARTNADREQLLGKDRVQSDRTNNRLTNEERQTILDGTRAEDSAEGSALTNEERWHLMRQ